MLTPLHGGPDAMGVPRHDLSSNGNACGAYPAALHALQRADACHYPDPACTALRRQLGDWQYASDYLPAAAPAPWPEQLERARRVAAALAQAAPADAAAAPLGADRLYALALRLQRLPLLGRALRAVPRSWRYRVRQLLSR